MLGNDRTVMTAPLAESTPVYCNMFRIAAVIMAVYPLLPGRSIQAAPPVKESSRDAVVIQHCEVTYEKSTIVSGHTGAGTHLPLRECLVRLGDRVKAGQVLGRLADRELRTQLARLKVEAQSDIEIRLAEARRDELIHKLKRIEKLRGKSQGGYVSDEEYETARIQVETARLTVEDAKYKHDIAAMECKATEVQILSREIVAPHDGYIVEIFKKPGETVVAGQPVFHIVDADRLRVTAYSNLADYTKIRAGQRIEITPELVAADPLAPPRKLEGKIFFVDRQIDPKSQTCRIVAEVDNHDVGLAAGLEVRMTIFTRSSLATSSQLSPPIPSRVNQTRALSTVSTSTP